MTLELTGFVISYSSGYDALNKCFHVYQLVTSVTWFSANFQ